jgi:transposase
LTVRAAADLVEDLLEAALRASEQSGYRIATVCSSDGGVPQGWFVVASQLRRQADLSQLDKTLAKATAQATVKVQKVAHQAFACEVDALAAVHRLEAQLPWHTLAAVTL